MQLCQNGDIMKMANVFSSKECLSSFCPLEEALKQAASTQYEQTPTRILRAEHLIAICVQTGRDKDRQRVRTFLEQATLERALLKDILQRHGLEAKFNAWIA
jgi:hypothetical protein